MRSEVCSELVWFTELYSVKQKDVAQYGTYFSEYTMPMAQSELLYCNFQAT